MRVCPHIYICFGKAGSIRDTRCREPVYSNALWCGAASFSFLFFGDVTLHLLSIEVSKKNLTNFTLFSCGTNLGAHMSFFLVFCYELCTVAQAHLCFPISPVRGSNHQLVLLCLSEAFSYISFLSIDGWPDRPLIVRVRELLVIFTIFSKK